MSSSVFKARDRDLWLNIGLFLCLGGVWLAIFATYFHAAWDFSMLYVVAHVPFAQIYDQQAFREYGRQLLAPLGITYYAPFLRPAVGALLLRPLRWFTYWTAFWIFASVQLTCCVGILCLCVRRLGVRPAVAAAVAFFYPVTMGIVTGQDISVMALIAVGGLVLLRDGNDLGGGLLLGFTTYKYNLFLFVPLLLIVRRSWRALAAWAATAATLTIVSVLLAPPAAYFRLLQSFEAYAIGFSPSKMISVRGLLWPTGTRLYILLAAVILCVAVYTMARVPIDQAFYAGQLAVLLGGYYVNWYDGALLVAPLAWLVAPTANLPRTPSLLLGKIAAFILLLGTPLWPFAPLLITGLMAIVFMTFCTMQSSGVDVANPKPRIS
jgi:hypothetical protein